MKLDAESELIFNAAIVNELKQEEEFVPPVESILFKPKFGPAVEVESRCIQSSVVLITHAIHPNRLYVQFFDKDLPLYHQMNEDLQQEFRWKEGAAQELRFEFDFFAPLHMGFSLGVFSDNSCLGDGRFGAFEQGYSVIDVSFLLCTYN